MRYKDLTTIQNYLTRTKLTIKDKKILENLMSYSDPRLFAVIMEQLSTVGEDALSIKDFDLDFKGMSNVIGESMDTQEVIKNRIKIVSDFAPSEFKDEILEKFFIDENLKSEEILNILYSSGLTYESELDKEINKKYFTNALFNDYTSVYPNDQKKFLKFILATDDSFLVTSDINSVVLTEQDKLYGEMNNLSEMETKKLKSLFNYYTKISEEN